MLRSESILEALIREGKLIDKNGSVLPQPTWTDSGNPMVYDCVFVLKSGDDRRRIATEVCLGIPRFYLPGKPGRLMRTPTNDYGQEQFDNILAAFVIARIARRTTEAREIFLDAVKHAFWLDTDGKLEGKDFMLRFIQVWLYGFAAAFPLLKWIVFLPLHFISGFMIPGKLDDSGGSSGIQLQWIFHMALADLYGDWIYAEWENVALQNFNENLVIYSDKDYYHQGHAFHWMNYWEYEKRGFGCWRDGTAYWRGK